MITEKNYKIEMITDKKWYSRKHDSLFSRLDPSETRRICMEQAQVPNMWVADCRKYAATAIQVRTNDLLTLLRQHVAFPTSNFVNFSWLSRSTDLENSFSELCRQGRCLVAPPPLLLSSFTDKIFSWRSFESSH